MVNQLFVGLLIAIAVLGLIGTAGFCLATRWTASTTLGVATAMATLGLTGWGTFWAYLASPALGRVVAVLLMAASLAVVVSFRRNERARQGLLSLLPALAMAFGVALVTAALFGLWGVDRAPFDLGRTRFSHWLAVDNEIPRWVLDKLVAGLDPRTAVVGWKSSDRPTLQSGLMAIVHNVTSPLGFDRSMAGVTAGIACELTWLPGVAILIRAIGGGRRGALAGMLFAAMTGTVLVNTIFTWPKMLSAGFVLAAIAVILEAGPRLTARRVALAGVLLAFALLSHGAALFALPIPLFLLLYRWRGLTVRILMAGAAGAVLTYLPWILYQRFYDPPGTRLLTWHLAGVENATDTGVVSEIVHAYKTAGWQAVLHDKWANLVTPIHAWPWDNLTLHGPNVVGRRVAEFFTMSTAIGLGWVPVLIVVAVVGITRLRRRARDPYAERVVLLLGLGLLSVVLWALVMFGPGTTFVHQGSHVFVLIPLALPLAWLMDRKPVAGVAVVAIGVALCLLTYVPFPALQNWPGATLPMARRAIVAGAIGAVLVLASFLATDPRALVRRLGGSRRIGGVAPAAPAALVEPSSAVDEWAA